VACAFRTKCISTIVNICILLAFSTHVRKSPQRWHVRTNPCGPCMYVKALRDGTCEPTLVGHAARLRRKLAPAEDDDAWPAPNVRKFQRWRKGSRENAPLRGSIDQGLHHK
jgi:hypothetical protein